MIYSEIKTIENMKSLHWREFEKFIEYTLKRKGYNAHVRKGVKDGGVDIDAFYEGEKYLIQCKKWDKYYVGVKELREFYGIMKSEDENSKGIYITTSYLSKEADKFAIKNNIEVWNRTNIISKLDLNSDINNFFTNTIKILIIVLFIIIPVFVLHNSGNHLKNNINKTCSIGYKKIGNKCEKIIVPKNAVLNKNGNKGWICKIGYENISNICTKIPVPKNSTFVSKYNSIIKWNCNYGYIRDKEKCKKVIYPKNATLDPYKGTYWNCNKGFKRIGNKCTIK